MLSAMATNEPTGSAGPPPAGWYPDPEVPGRRRYWDGGRWTDHVDPPSPPPPAPGPSGAAQAGPGVPVAQPTSDADARQWALFAHLSALLALLIGLPFLGPLVIYLVKKDDHPFIADQAREALNFNLSVFIYGVVGFIAMLVLFIVVIGVLLIPVLIALGIGWLVFVIIAAVKANSGETYRYPLTIRMVS